MKKIKVNYTNEMAYYNLSNFLKDYINSKTLLLCIGTDRCIGDSLGPMVGTMLKSSFFPLPIFGTIKHPIHALNLEAQLKALKETHKDYKIIGVDACIGDSDFIGEIQIRNYPIHPGKGVGKSLPDVGDCSIVGIVDSCDTSELFTNRNIRLDLIMDMASIISKAIIHSYYLYLKDNEIIFV